MGIARPRFDFEVRKAREQAGRQDLRGGGCDALIPASPPKEAIESRRRQADETARGEYVYKIPNSGQGNRKGDRPGRKRDGRQ